MPSTFQLLYIYNHWIYICICWCTFKITNQPTNQPSPIITPRHSEEHHGGMTDDHRIAMVHQPILGRIMTDWHRWWRTVTDGDFRSKETTGANFKVEWTKKCMMISGVWEKFRLRLKLILFYWGFVGQQGFDGITQLSGSCNQRFSLGPRPTTYHRKICRLSD